MTRNKTIKLLSILTMALFIFIRPKTVFADDFDTSDYNTYRTDEDAGTPSVTD